MANRRYAAGIPSADRSPPSVLDPASEGMTGHFERVLGESPDRAYEDFERVAFYRSRRRSRSGENGRAYKRRRSQVFLYDTPRGPDDHMYFDSWQDPLVRRPRQSFPLDAYHDGPLPMRNSTSPWNGTPLPREAPAVADPTDLEYLLSYKEFIHFMEGLDGYARPLEEMSRRYTLYKENFFAKQAKKFFDEHKTEEWFKDKYHPIDHLPFRAECFARRRRLLPEFLKIMEEGLIDGISFDEPPPAIDEKKDPFSYVDEIPAADNPLNWMMEEVSKRTLFIKTVPLSVSRKDVEMAIAEELGDMLDYISFSDPNPQKRFFRQAWIVVKDLAKLDEAHKALEGKKVDDVVFHFSKPSGKKDLVRPRYAPESAGTERQLKVDLERIKTLAEIMESEAEFTEDVAPLVLERANRVIANMKSSDSQEMDNADKTTLLELKKAIDMLSVYLRHVHMFCYYCGLESDSLEELNRKCGLHYRKRHGSEPIPKEKNWHKYHDGKLEMKIRGADFEVEKVGGRNVAIALDRVMEGNIELLNEKYKCKTCGKMFKGDDFVKKHIKTKHPEILAEPETELTYFNNYIRDPNHLTPSILPNPNALPMPPQPIPLMPPPPAPGMFLPIQPMIPPGFAFPFAAATMGTPHDQIPRVGFDIPENPRRGSRHMVIGPMRRAGPEMKSENKVPPPPPPPEGTALDPRTVRSYEDLDAPAQGGSMDAEISFF